MKKEDKKTNQVEKDTKSDFVSIEESISLQEKGYHVVEIKVFDGVTKHRLEKGGDK